MIVALRTRQQFDQIVQGGSRIRRGQLWCTWCPDLDSQNASVGFSITRAVGPAVVRNRLRRQLRAILRIIDNERPLPAVLMLIGARPDATELTYAQLTAIMTDMVATLRTRAATSPTGPQSSFTPADASKA